MDEELQRKLNRQFLYSMNLSEEQNTKPIRKSSPGTSLKKVHIYDNTKNYVFLT